MIRTKEYWKRYGFIMLFLLFLQLADWALTTIGLTFFLVKEVNPIGAYLFSKGVFVALLAKLFVWAWFVYGGYCWFTMKKKTSKTIMLFFRKPLMIQKLDFWVFKNRYKAINITTIGISLLYSAVVLNNIYQLVR